MKKKVNELKLNMQKILSAQPITSVLKKSSTKPNVNEEG